jgi:nucleotide-binding universal stress UspA family protein
MFEHILVPLDGSELAESVLPQVEALAGKFGSRVTLLRAAATAADYVGADDLTPSGVAPLAGTYNSPLLVEAELDYAAQWAEQSHQSATEYLAAVAKRLSDGGLAAETALVDDPAGPAIITWAGANGVDLIAMTTHGRSGLGRLLMGSVADNVVRHTTCPVLLVRIHGG